MPALETLDRDFTVCKVGNYEGIDLGEPFVFTGRTDGECSLVCPTELAPGNCIDREDGWRGFRVRGILDFSIIGLLARLTALLAEAKIGVFVLSTYNTDYVFVKKERFAEAMDVLAAAGYPVTSLGGERKLR